MKLYRDLPIKTKYIVILISFVFIPFCIIGVFILNIWDKQQKEQARNTQLYQINFVNEELEGRLSEVERVSLTLVGDKELQRILSYKKREGRYYPIIVMRKIDNAMRNVGQIENVQILLDREIVYEAGNCSFVPEEDFSKVEDDPIRWHGAQIMYSFDGGEFTKSNWITTYRNAVEYSNIVQEWAVIDVNLYESSVSQIYSSIVDEKSGAVFLTNGKGEVISSSDKDFLNTGLPDEFYPGMEEGREGCRSGRREGRDYLFYWTYNAVTGGYLCKIEYVEKTIPVWYIYLFLFICIILLSVLCCMFVQERYINRPLRELANSINSFRQNERFDMNLLPEYKGEIGQLMSGFNELIQKVYVEQICRQKAELDLMTTQINPHFLYNTLDSIHWTALAAGDREAGEQLEVLADFLKGSLNFGRQVISLQEELDLIDDYCYLYQKRFHEKVNYEQKVEDGCRNMQIPKLIIQPLIENAFTHGLKKRMRGGKICLYIYVRRGYLVIMAADNGVGCDQEEIRREMEQAESKRCFALHNIRERLSLIYGEDYSIRFRSCPGAGTCVRIRIPAHRKEE